MYYQLQHGRSEMPCGLFKIFSASEKVCHDSSRYDSKMQVLLQRGSYIAQLESLILACGSVPPELRMTAKLRTLRISYHLSAAQEIS